jgi:RNA polymerase sigma-70 factor (ECF subfamily)
MPAAVTLRSPEGPTQDARSSAERELLTRLYVEHGAAVYGTALRLTGCSSDAEDVLQDVFVALPEALHTFRGDGSMEGWLRRVAARLALTRMRTRRRRGEVALPAPGQAEHPTALPGDAAARVALDQAIAALPESLRTVFVLREVEGCSHDEIAALLDIAPGASQVRLHRAKAALRTLLGSPR